MVAISGINPVVYNAALFRDREKCYKIPKLADRVLQIYF